jgi:hypothetical protein
LLSVVLRHAVVEMPDLSLRDLATGLAVNRLLFGGAFLLAPEGSSRSWIGSAAGTHGGRVMVRATGARDLALATGALTALRSDGDARPWFAAQAVADGSDFLATWAEREGLSRLSTVYALTVAGASTAIAAAYAFRGGTRGQPSA